MTATVVRGVQDPRISSVPPAVSSRGQEAIEVAAAVGLILDPFQERVLVDSLGVRADGKWAAFEVGMDIPRQNGKGGVLEARELAGILAFGERLIMHSAHEFQTATEAMLRMEELLAADPAVAAQVKSVSRSHGSEGFVFKTGQRLRYRTRTKGGGRGFSGDTLIFDEAMILQETFIGALLPTLSAQSVTGNPQVIYAGSAVDQTVHEHGRVFARLRARALAGDDPSLAWFEWCGIDPFDEDGNPITPDHPAVVELLNDLEAWAAANPALGIRISEEHLGNELRSMDDRTFAVERLGIGDWPSLDGSDTPIDLDAWNALVDIESKAVDPVCFAYDVTPDRSSAAIGVAGRRTDTRTHVEVVEHRDGTSWVVGRLIELNGEHASVSVLCDGASQAASLVPELEEAGLTVQVVNAREHANACGLLFDLTEQRGLRHLGTAELRAALRGAKKRLLGDAWAWSRKSSTVDISPLVACTLAVWGAATIKPRKKTRWRPVNMDDVVLDEEEVAA